MSSTSDRLTQRLPGLPDASGLYDPAFEHDACGVAFVVDIHGRASHEIVQQGLTALQHLGHRGASGDEVNTGDGAGALIQVPDAFLGHECAASGFDLPPAGEYGVGMVFLPAGGQDVTPQLELIQREVERSGLELLGWRDVPQHNHEIGTSARAGEPDMRQVFVGLASEQPVPRSLELRLYLARRRIEQAAQGALYISSMSSRTLIYKGMLTADQLPVYFPDLTNPATESALTLVHQRFSTNTFPSWSLAHPYRYLAHNGEINTLRGNVNWMRAREHLLQSDVFGDDLAEILPVIQPGGSDSAALDNVLELLVMSGRSLPHALRMLIPEPWQHHEEMDSAESAFYNYHSSLMEPWDGPAAVAFTDGVTIGAMLDRNGLRPGRFYVTRGGQVILASEVGVLDIPAEDIVQKGRLIPGSMLLVDTAQGRIVPDAEIKSAVAANAPYRTWLEQERVALDQLPVTDSVPALDQESLGSARQVFGYTDEEARLLIGPMAMKGEEPIGSMGNDTPLAVLSGRPQLLFSYFKQLFAQVTNPPLDAIREELVTSLASLIGPAGNLLHPGPEACRQIEIPSPLLNNVELARIRASSEAGFSSVVLPMLFDVRNGHAGLDAGLDTLFEAATGAIDAGATILILSDRGTDEHHAPIPSLLATAGLHHHLVRQGNRTRAALIVESGEPREVHHFCVLLGYGANAINPYLALDTVQQMTNDGRISGVNPEQAGRQYLKAINKGVLKVMSKMGISTIDSYRGAQIFEAVGLGQGVIERYFPGTPSRIGGIELDVIAREAIERHRQATDNRLTFAINIGAEGQYQWRRDGEQHAVNPDMIQKLQHATRTANYARFKEYTCLVNGESQRTMAIRGLLDLKSRREPVPLDEVEPVESILKRFSTGAMSFGAISIETHEAIALAMNSIGGMSNSGEGGEDRTRFAPDPDGTWRNSAVKQIASGRFGVTSEYLNSAAELQIKMAQGAKPGEGGQLPGDKVDDVIARVRHSIPGVGLISPPPHHDIYSIEDLAQLIYDLKNSNNQARISVKLVAEVGVGTVAAGVAKAHADVILISGHDGGTGAAPLTGMKHAGIPWELGLAETQQVLMKNNLRDRVIIQTDGQLKTGRDVVIAALLGAEEYGFSTAPLVVLGCVMMRVCHMNTCPVGIATQDPELRKLFRGKPEHVVTFFRFIAEDVREHMALLGFRTMDEMIGRTDMLDVRATIDHYETKGLDLTRILQTSGVDSAPRRRMQAQNHGLDGAIDIQLIEMAQNALADSTRLDAQFQIANVNRTVGTMLGSEVTRRYGDSGLPQDTINLTFNGSAGQSFGAFIPGGVSLTLIGDANDYVGKGLSGGKIIVYPPAGSTFERDENVLIGNVALYGATGGEAFFSGLAGERFAVRNSGANAVVEGVGDHGCEYMTGGRIIILGRTGRNFAAGMSGGIAYVYDQSGLFSIRCNPGTVDLEALDDPFDISLVRTLIERHQTLTSSPKASAILADWEVNARRFVKVMPREYRHVLQQSELMAGSEARFA